MRWRFHTSCNSVSSKQQTSGSFVPRLHSPAFYRTTYKTLGNDARQVVLQVNRKCAKMAVFQHRFAPTRGNQDNKKNPVCIREPAVSLHTLPTILSSSCILCMSVSRVRKKVGGFTFSLYCTTNSCRSHHMELTYKTKLHNGHNEFTSIFLKL